METEQMNIKSAIIDLFDYNLNEIYPCTINFLEIEMLKNAFRKKAKLYHPDRAYILGIDENELNTKFQNINNSYQYLLDLLKNRTKTNVNIKTDFNYSKTAGFTDQKNNTFFYNGALPERKLRLAEYLYYTRRVNWKTMIDALVWQYRNRPRTGEIALSMEYLDHDSFIQVMKNLKINEKFGETALRIGKLNSYQVNVILGKQKLLKKPIGKYFTENYIITAFQIEKYILENRLHNFKCG